MSTTVLERPKAQTSAAAMRRVSEPTKPTRSQRINTVIEFLTQPDMRVAYKRSLYQRIEDISTDKLRAISTNDTSFELVVTALNEAGIPTAPNVGSIMDVLSLTHQEVHDLGCYCNSNGLSGIQLAIAFGNLLHKKIK